MTWIIAYGLCPLIGGWIIWRKQGKYLTDEQPFAFFLGGPLTLLLSALPKSWFTSREKAGER
jgi:hypothetical protein